MATAGLVTCLEGEGGELVTSKLGLLGTADGGRSSGGKGRLHTKTILFSAHPFTARAASEGNKINGMK